MKKALLGASAGVVLMVAALYAIEPGFDMSGRGPSMAPQSGSDLIVIPTAAGDKGQMLTVVDARQRVMSVYRIDPTNGRIALKSVRNITWDLQLSDFNSEAPLPRELRSQIEQR